MVWSSSYSFLPQIQTMQTLLLRQHTFYHLKLKSFDFAAFLTPLTDGFQHRGTKLTLLTRMTSDGSSLCGSHVLAHMFIRLSSLDSGLGDVFFLPHRPALLAPLGSHIWFSEITPQGALTSDVLQHCLPVQVPLSGSSSPTLPE